MNITTNKLIEFSVIADGHTEMIPNRCYIPKTNIALLDSYGVLTVILPCNLEDAIWKEYENK